MNQLYSHLQLYSHFLNIYSTLIPLEAQIASIPTFAILEQTTMIYLRYISFFVTFYFYFFYNFHLKPIFLGKVFTEHICNSTIGDIDGQEKINLKS